ncbi:methyltransferase [Candidatus Woesearchaeota archaeon]|nr:methyltransferase [Candidatus Woesearchaeota archaeon]
MEHYFSKRPKSKHIEKLVFYRINSDEFKFRTSSSVFSRKKIDRGTDLLIKKCRIRKGSKILDIGCGYGAVGVVISKRHPDCRVIMTDINERALSLARKNLELNKTEAEVLRSDLYKNIRERFDVILSNPPQTAGKKVCIDIINGAYDYLKKSGALQLVARHQKGGKSLSGKMEEVFGNTATLGRQSGYHLYYSKKS